MKNKRILSLVLAGLFVASAFAGCSANQDIKTAEKTTEASTQVTTPNNIEDEIMDAPEEELVSFDDTDKDKNKLTVVPIFDRDGVTVVAGYVMKAVDKDGKELTSKECKELNTVVSASDVKEQEATAVSNDMSKAVVVPLGDIEKQSVINTAEKKDSKKKENKKKAKLDKNQDGTLISVLAYSTEDGSIVAMQDHKDLNGNMVFEELLKVNTRKDDNDISKSVVEYKEVVVNKSGNGYVMTVDGEKIKVLLIDANNDVVADKTEKLVEKNKAVEKKAKAKSMSTTTTKKAEEQQTTKPAENQATTTTTTTTAVSEKGTTFTEDYQIVLKPNGKADTNVSADKVTLENNLVTIKDVIPPAEKKEFVITSETNDWHGRIVIDIPRGKSCDVKFKDVHISYNVGSIIEIVDREDTTQDNFIEQEGGEGTGAEDQLGSTVDNDKAPDVSISFPEGTHSSFTSSANNTNGVLKNKSRLTIKGNGIVDIASTTNADNCICSKKSITIKNVTINLSTAQNNTPENVSGSMRGIFSKSKIKMESGTLNVKTNGDAIRCNEFKLEGGTVNLYSSACDGIDADSELMILGGSITSITPSKSILKVRKVNIHEKWLKSKSGPEPANGVFQISGGTVIGEGKKASVVQASAQPVIACIVYNSDNTFVDEAGKVRTHGKPTSITIKQGTSTVLSSTNMVTTLFYSNGGLAIGETYTMNANGEATNVIWKSGTKIGTASLLG